MRLSRANELPDDSTDGDQVDCAADNLDGDGLLKRSWKQWGLD
jgi:hypothetical protein